MPFSYRYAGGRLDRADAHRKDPAWVADALRDPDARVVAMWRDGHLVRAALDDEGPSAALLPVDAFERDGALERHPWIFLGLDGARPLFATEATDEERERIAAIGGGEFGDLRRVGPLLGDHEAALLAYARGMLLWHRRHRFCGVCGSATEVRCGGHVRTCTNAACATESYPRTDPAVIMLIEHRPSEGPPVCLLARSTRFPPRAVSTLAGFVEPGESLEEAVAREAWEEAGVRVDHVDYRGSQPWPFPSSIMVGFRAIAISRELRVDSAELQEAHWFTAEEVRTFGEWGDESATFRLPRRDSIARSLIEEWMGER